MKRAAVIVGFFGVVFVVAMLVSDNRKSDCTARCVCEVSVAAKTGQSTDVGRYVGDILRQKRVDILKDAFGHILLEEKAGSPGGAEKCRVLALSSACVVEMDLCKCVVAIEAKSRMKEVAKSVARAYAEAVKSAIEHEEQRLASRALEEAQLDAFKARLRKSGLVQALEAVKGKATMAESEIESEIEKASMKCTETAAVESKVRAMAQQAKLSALIRE